MTWAQTAYLVGVVVPAVVATGALSWMVVQLARSPRNRGLWVLTGCVMAGATQYLLAWYQQTSPNGLAKLGQNLTMVVFQFLLVCFFLYSTNDARRIRRQGLICLVVVALLVAFWVMTPSAYRGYHHDAIFSPDFPFVSMRLFQLTGSIYACYIVAIAGHTSWRFAGLSRQPLSMGLRIIALALGGKCIGAAERTAAVLASWTHHPLPEYSHASAGLVLWASQATFLLGVVYPSLTGRILAARRWWDHRRAYRRLKALWSALHEVYPQTMLHRVPQSKVRHILDWHSMHRRYYRRAIECRDGLVYISPYLPRPAQGQRPRTADQWARELRTALTASANHYPPVEGAMLVAEPAGSDLESDVAELVALSQALANIDKRSQSGSR